ncbi:MAG: DUF2157 domain-containing protein [Limnoraphis robusta]|uniref:DUF2157 domain-containing protein n=1 Tax=Limnoraphis robusta CS-951 TaxID=1637645 RepID=A0A0F5Y9M4_9CYAN|nr:DUF2157 domain-containing protein [Limnoraphis robusta]KKD35544.1 hypothetical protein WN50_24820 [Limnoraphis robusta CS-951]KMW70122.1 hypothetical protein WN50_37710 [Limnoraphis robusta CS-951]
MASEKFRRQLRHEAQLWTSEGLINDSIYQLLSNRYQFNSIDSAASSRFVMILIGLGSILLGLGVITFVAANWQQWPREFKIILLLSLFIGVNTSGFYLWRSDSQTGKTKRLGEGLLIFGAISLGANISLMAQMFHIGGSPYGLFLVWGLGVLAMAYSLRLTSLGILSILLLGIGYWSGVSNIFFPGELTGLEFLLVHIALVTAVLFVPLAYWCKSRSIFIIAVLLIVPALEMNIAALLRQNFSSELMTVGFILPPALLWSYDDSLFPPIHSRPFRSDARSLAIWFLGIVFFLFSFRGFGTSFFSFNYNESMQVQGFNFILDVLLFGGLTIWQWLYLAKPHHSSQRWGLDEVSSAIAIILGVTTLVSYRYQTLDSSLSTLIFNILLFLLAAGSIRIGLGQGKRGTFWGGMILLTLQIVSRTFEYNTELLFKAFVFVLCGVGVILAGLWFERHLSRQ